MPVVSLRIPQIGEGLQEARVVAFLKQPGDRVARDEPIYQMETDKAVMDVESPHEGTLVEWLAAVDDVLAIGAEVARMEVAEGVEEVVPSHGAPTPTATAPEPKTEDRVEVSTARLRNVPPRTRAYAREKGLTDDDLATLAAQGGKVMPEDIDAFLAGSGTVGKTYEERALTGPQRILASRLQRGSQLVVPGTMTVACEWTAIEAWRERQRTSGDAFQPSIFTAFAYCVARTLADHPAFRSSLVGDDKVRTYHHANLGIAVARPGDELVLAVVDEADALDWRTFAERTWAQIEKAREGHDQANETVTLSLTNMQRYGLREAVPVVVPPSIATLFLGEVYWGFVGETQPEPRRLANLGLTFDHRLINGVGAANFLNEIRAKIEAIDDVLA